MFSFDSFFFLMNLFDFSFAIFGVVSGSIPWRLFCKKKVFGLFDVFDVYSPIFSSFDLYCYTISCNFSCNKYVRRACEPRICIVWTSSSSSSSLHVAIFVSQVVPVLSHVEVQFFSVSTLRQKRPSCPSMAGPWVSFSLDRAYAARITWNIGRHRRVPAC